MKQKIAKVKEQLTTIVDKLLLNLGGVDEELIDELLDSRDSDPFDSNWVEAYEILTQNSKNINTKEKMELDKFLEEIRKEVFIKTMKASKSSDLAAYVSDDFEMIGTAFIQKFSNSFIASMVNSYRAGVVPDNSMEMIKERIREEQ